MRTRASWLLPLLLLCSMVAVAQVTVGDNLNLRLNGGLGYGYGGTFGNELTTSSHTQGFNGNADLTGYYFNPNFISFQFRPYYQRDQVNTEAQNVTRSTGFASSANFFAGSRFPGSISFGRDFSSNSQFLIAGFPTLAVDSSGQNFGITWSALVPDYPRVTASYTIGSATSELLGGENHSSSRNFNLNSSYQLGGWDLHGTFNHTSSSFRVPEFLTGEPVSGGGSGTGYGVSASHRLPLKGNIGLSWAHTSFGGENGTSWSSNYYTLTNSFMPWHRLTLFQTASYTTNLTAALGQSIVNGGNVADLRSESDSQGFSYGAGASFQVGHGLTTSAHFTHRVQWLMGREFKDTQFGGNVNYNTSHRLFGMLYFGLGVVDTYSKNGNDGLGFNATVGMSRRFGNWETAADFNYFQSVQTLVGVATTSSYMYGASVKRKISNELRFSAGFRGSHSGLVLTPGSGNRGESVSTSVSWRKYNFGAAYAQSNGVAVFSNSGEITPTPIGPILTDNFVLFNGQSWSANASTLLFRHLSVSGGYSRFSTRTMRLTDGVFDKGNRYHMRAEYRLRRFSVIGGYTHSWQYVSTLTEGPRVVNSYYVSLMRWFNVF